MESRTQHRVSDMDGKIDIHIRMKMGNRYQTGKRIRIHSTGGDFSVKCKPKIRRYLSTDFL